MYPIYKQFAAKCITRTIAQWLGHRICNIGIDEKYIFLFILLNKMHITFYRKQSHGEHDIFALLHFSCVISCNIRIFKQNHIDNMSKQKSNHFLSSKPKKLFSTFLTPSRKNRRRTLGHSWTEQRRLRV